MALMKYAKVALRNLFSKPVTTQYPFEPAVYPERSRGRILLEQEKCILCGLCSSHCPTGTITVDRKAGTWSMNRFDCVQCGYCAQVCPKSALRIVPGYFTPNTEKIIETNQVKAPAAAKSPAPKPGAGEPPAAAPAASAASVPAVNSDCILCGACASQCPAGAITVGDSWSVNAEACLGCGACVSACPVSALHMAESAAAPAAAPTAAEAPKQEEVKKPTGRRVYIPQYDKDGEEIPVPACTKPDYVDEWADLPVSDPEKCIYCTLCAKKCPKSAITVDRKEKVWEVDNAECIRCGVCAETCPKQCITLPDVGPELPQAEEEEPDFIIACLEPGYNDQFPDLPKQGAGCIYCTLCAKRCPKGALTVDRAEKTWSVDNENCIRCGVCVVACPKYCITL